MDRPIALSVHSPLLALSGPLTVRTVFARSLHLHTLRREVVTLTTERYNGPFTIRLSALPPLHPGREVRIQGQTLTGPLSLDLSSAPRWDPPPIPASRPPPGKLRAWVHEAQARQEAAARGGITLRGTSDWTGRALGSLTGLEEGLRQGTPELVRTGVLGLLGLGPGLTPAGDDVLIGLLIGLHRFQGEGAALALLRPALVPAPARTTALSATLLSWAGRGVATEALLTVLWNLGNEQAVENLLTIGHSSGSDMLTGAVLAARIVMGEKDGASLAHPA